MHRGVGRAVSNMGGNDQEERRSGTQSNIYVVTFLRASLTRRQGGVVNNTYQGSEPKSLLHAQAWLADLNVWCHKPVVHAASGRVIGPSLVRELAKTDFCVGSQWQAEEMLGDGWLTGRTADYPWLDDDSKGCSGQLNDTVKESFEQKEH